MKILFAPADFTFSDKAGSKPSWCYNYIKALLKRGVEIVLICENEDQSCKIIDKNFTVISKSNTFNSKPNIIKAGLFQLWLTIKAPAIIKQYGPFDSIHHFGNFGNRTSFNLPLIFGLFKNIPFIFGPLEEEVKTKDKNWGWISITEKFVLEILYALLFKNLVRLTLQKSTKVICQGPTAKAFYSRISKANYTIINPGILELNKKTTKSKRKHIEIITIGSTNKLKRIDLIINVFERIKQIEKEAKLKIIGSGPEDHNLKTLIKQKNLEKSVSLLGQLKPDQVKNELINSDLYINASVYESFGQAMLEAMASGLPIIASETPGSKILIDDSINGYIIKNDSHEIENFTVRILEILKSKRKLDLMSKKSTYRTKKLFLWDKLVDKYLKIYKDTQNAN